MQLANDISSLEMWIRLILPVFILWMVLFYVLFELVLNICAELIRFGDRHFYLDWWYVVSILRYSAYIICYIGTVRVFSSSTGNGTRVFMSGCIYLFLVIQWKR